MDAKQGGTADDYFICPGIFIMHGADFFIYFEDQGLLQNAASGSVKQVM